MDMHEEIVIAAPRDRVYEALNDPDILRRCIPGCEELVRTSETEFEARVMLKIGPVKARFKGGVTLDPTDAPAHFSLSGQGTGGAAGFVKGSAEVDLEDRGGETLLRYRAKADVGGKLAQLGSRLVASTSRKLAAQFFETFSEIVVGQP